MGANLSQEQENSPQQIQPPPSPSRPQTTVPQTYTTTNPNSLNNNNNINIAKQERIGSSQKSQQPIASSTPSKSEAINNHNKANKPEEKVLVHKVPHNYEAIIKESDSRIETSSLEKLYERLHAGVYLNGRKKKYWVEKKGNINCFMVFAPGLSITWSQDLRYWQWHDVETSEGKISVAVLRNVCWLEVHGRLNTTNLTPGVTYQVAYVIKFEYSSYGWEVPVNLRLTLPNGSKQEHKETFKDKQRDEWFRVPVGEFKVTHDNMGEIEFSMYEYEGGNWKKGLVIKGVVIEPKVI